MRRPRIPVIELLLVMAAGFVCWKLATAVWTVFATDIVTFLLSVRGVVDREPYPSPNRWWGLLAMTFMFVCVIVPFRLFLNYLAKVQSREK